MKKAAIGAAIVIGVVIVILAVIPFMVDLNKYKGTILAQVKNHINRPVDFKSISLTILSGVGAEIKGLRIADDPAFSKTDFVTLNRVKVKLAVMPLLQKKIKVREVVLDSPVISVVRNSSGVMNFKTLLVPKPEEKPKVPKPGGLAALLVSNAKIRNGQFTFRDDKNRPGQQPFAVNDIDLDAKDISVSKPVSFTLKAAVMSPRGQNLELEGTVGPMPEGGKIADTLVDLNLKLDKLPLAALPVKLPVRTGILAVDFRAKGKLNEKVASSLKADFTDLTLKTSKTAPEAKVAGLSGSVSSDFSLEYLKEILLIQNGVFELNKEKGAFSGTVTGIKTKPSWDIKVKSDRFTPAAVLGQLPGAVPAGLKMSGPIGFSLSTSGTKEAFKLDTAADMRAMQMVFGKFLDKPANVPMSLTSAIQKEKDITRITGLDVVLGPITAKGSGLVQKVREKSQFSIGLQSNPVPLQTAQTVIPMLRNFKPNGNVTVKTTVVGGGGPLAINIQATSDNLNMLLSSKPGGKMISGPMTAVMSGLNLNVDAVKQGKAVSANGTMKAARGTMINIPFKSLAGAFSYGNDRFQLSSFNIDALKGSIKGSASYNLKTKAWSSAPSFSNIEAANILDILNNFRGVFSGTISGDLKAGGVAGQPALNNLASQGSFTIRQGEWKNFDLAGTALNALTGIQGLPAVLGLSPSAQQYQNTRFDNLSTSMNLAHKVINVDTMNLVNISSGRQSDIDARLKGTISMETNQLSLKGQILLPKSSSQRLAGKQEAFAAVMDEQKRIVLPLTITGSLKKPIPTVDSRALRDAFARYYSGKLLEKGLKKLPPEGGKAVEDLLKGIFK